MPAYAANRRSRRRLSPPALALIVAGHAAVIALIGAAKMDVIPFVPRPNTETYNVPLDPPPPPPEAQPKPQPETKLPPPPDSFIDRVPPVVPLPQPNAGPAVELGPNLNTTVPDVGTLLERPLVEPRSEPLPPADPVRLAARAMTPTDLLRPPYPDAKRRSEEEATLRLRLSIDPRGRVTAVEPVGAADPAFLAAARAHLLRHWRYRPASEDGRPVASSLTITLRFELED